MKETKVKVVCTIGPASWDPEVLRKMYEAGMKIARINGAFADNAELERVGKLMKSVSPDIDLMLDIKGHQVRFNKFKDDIELTKGMEIEIGSSEDDLVYPVTYPELYKDLQIGNVIVCDDGNVKAEVTAIGDKGFTVKILEGKVLKGGKSLNVPGVHLNNPPLTERDKEQIRFCAERNWEFVAASFIRTMEDVKIVREALNGSTMKFIAKVEDQEGVNNIDDIIENTEGVMIARGDMGIEMPMEKIPFVQKMIIKKCKEKNKISITATQMMKSMAENPIPTRAEVSDVANAVIDGTDYVMTSEESSTGKYPAETIQMMQRIIIESEKHL